MMENLGACLNELFYQYFQLQSESRVSIIKHHQLSSSVLELHQMSSSVMKCHQGSSCVIINICHCEDTGTAIFLFPGCQQKSIYSPYVLRLLETVAPLMVNKESSEEEGIFACSAAELEDTNLENYGR